MSPGAPAIKGLLFDKDGTLFDYQTTWGIVRLFSLVEDVLIGVISSSQFVGARVPLTKCVGPFLAIGGGGHLVAAGAEQVYGFIMDCQKPLGLAG